MSSIHVQFANALDDLVAQLKLDKTILAVDGKKTDCSSLALYARGVNVHAFLMPRMEFRKTVEGTVRNSFMHSLLAKGRRLYTHDETLVHLCAQLHKIGDRDSRQDDRGT
jgi:hypothetical protein